MNMLENVTLNGCIWALIGIPAILGWIGAGVFWLLEPRLVIEATYLDFAMVFVGGWYALLLVIFGGWLGLLVLASGL